MKRKEISRLASSNPTSNKEQPPSDLFNEIVADPRPEGRSTPRRSGFFRNRFLQIGAAIFAAFAIGSGVSWAANGEFPGGGLFGHEPKEGLSVGEDDVTSEDFSVLHPAPQNAVDELPEATLDVLQHVRVIPPTPLSEGGSLDAGIDLEPGTITAVGESRTEPSGDVSIVAIIGMVCSVWVETGLGNCETPAVIAKRGMTSAGHFGPGGARVAYGLFNDSVAAVRLEGTHLPDVPVSGNVFEVAKLPESATALVGIDSRGDEVTRMALP